MTISFRFGHLDFPLTGFCNTAQNRYPPRIGIWFYYVVYWWMHKGDLKKGRGLAHTQWWHIVLGAPCENLSVANKEKPGWVQTQAAWFVSWQHHSKLLNHFHIIFSDTGQASAISKVQSQWLMILRLWYHLNTDKTGWLAFGWHQPS